MEVGDIVQSKCGRDSGRFFCVVALQKEDKVFISDGRTHKLLKPKLKNKKHLIKTGAKRELIAEKIALGKKVFDSEIASAVKEYNINISKR